MDTALLERDLDRLQAALADAVETLGGDVAVARYRELGEVATALRRGEVDRDQLASRIGALTDAELEETARAYATRCHLMNVAEERARLRTLATRGTAPADGLVAAIDELADQLSETELRAWFDRALVMPVITAHPTEARRRSSLDHINRIGALLADTHSHEALQAEVLALFATESARVRRPVPLDEVDHALDVFRRSLLDVTPRIYRTIEARLRARGYTWKVPCFFRWGTWVAGDRDGNPNVTAAVTRGAFARHRAVVLERYRQDVAALGRELSMSERLRAGGELDELTATLTRYRERLPETAARAERRTPFEPWRELLWYIGARLVAAAEHRDDGYVDADEYIDDLEVLDRSLRACGFAAVAGQGLRDAIRRAEVFGFHLATLDLRQHSEVHERVVDELLTRAGTPGYKGLDEAARRTLLSDVLGSPVTPLRDPWDCSPEAQEVLATLEVAGRARRELGPHACERYVVSFTRDVSDMLEVVFLARAAGLAPGELRPVPLLEQLEDLERAGAIARDVLATPVLRQELGAQPELEVMIGYSDSGKQVGYVASTVALRHAQLDLVEAAAGVTLTVFHGRGGAIGRGGGPASEAIRAQPPSAVRGRLRVTEQGETVTARYAHPAIAERDLELTIAAIMNAALVERAGEPAEPWREDSALGRAAEAARQAYLALRSDEDRLVRYTLAATPIEDVAHLPLGSRPASRKGTLSLDTLRAIPWVFSWTQSRHGLPGWFGVGTAIDALVAELGVAGAKALVDGSRFARALITNTELSLVRSDIAVAARYAQLADPDARGVFRLVETEHQRTLAALATIGHARIGLANRPYLTESIARRNAHLDILSHVQIEALKRRRTHPSDPERLARIIFTTIGGIAAGLQTAG